MSVLFTRRGEPPLIGKMLSDYAEGDIVYLNENGNPVAFYVVKHNYESDLNSPGRTLLVRKDCYGSIQWNSAGNNEYAGSTIDNWLNGTYKSLLDASVQEAMGSTIFEYFSYSAAKVTTLFRSVFLLSCTELGFNGATAPHAITGEGEALPISATLLIAYYNGSAVVWSTRSAGTTTSTTAVNYVDSSGRNGGGSCTDSRYARPVLTLPGASLFDEKTNTFKKGVA